MPYQEYLPKTLPPPLRGPWATAFHAGVGTRMDSIIEDYRQAIFSRLPGICPNDALDVTGLDRGLPRGPGETDDSYRARLVNAWEAWAGDDTPIVGRGGGAGSPLGLLLQLKVAGLPMGPTGATFVQQNGRYAQLDVAGNLVLGTLSTCTNRTDLTGAVNPRPGWTFEGRDNFYSEFGLLFLAPVASFDPAVVNAVIATWRPAKALFIGTWVIEVGRTFGWPVGQTWGDGSLWGGNTVSFYPGPGADNQRIGYAL